MRVISDSFNIVGRPFLARAIELAIQGGLRTTRPNPLVGCVIVKNGEIVGEGWHEFAGGPHAELMALEKAGEHAQGATVYVTLEPCSHHGKTGPCTHALIEAGVSRVVIGERDPHLRAAGGAGVLENAGIEVEFAEDTRPFHELTRGWKTRLLTGKPYVRAKLGLSLDGALSFKNAHTTITAASGREVVHRLREYADAVLITASTANIDNPTLTLRGFNGALLENQPQRIILVRAHTPRKDLAVFNTEGGPVIILAPDSLEEDFSDYPAKVMRYDSGEGLEGALKALGASGLNSILIEPGQRLFTELINSALIDELVTVTAGGFLGNDAQRCYDGIATLQNVGSNAFVMQHVMVPFDTKIFGDVVATMWRKRAHRER